MCLLLLSRTDLEKLRTLLDQVRRRERLKCRLAQVRQQEITLQIGPISELPPVPTFISPAKSDKREELDSPDRAPAESLRVPKRLPKAACQRQPTAARAFLTANQQQQAELSQKAETALHAAHAPGTATVSLQASQQPEASRLTRRLARSRHTEAQALRQSGRGRCKVRFATRPTRSAAAGKGPTFQLNSDFRVASRSKSDGHASQQHSACLYLPDRQPAGDSASMPSIRQPSCAADVANPSRLTLQSGHKQSQQTNGIAATSGSAQHGAAVRESLRVAAQGKSGGTPPNQIAVDQPANLDIIADTPEVDGSPAAQPHRVKQRAGARSSITLEPDDTALVESLRPKRQRRASQQRVRLDPHAESHGHGAVALSHFSSTRMIPQWKATVQQARMR